MQISHFMQTDQQTVSEFWYEIFQEMGWIANDKDGFDDISAFFKLSQGIFLTIKDNKGKINGCSGVKPLQIQQD